MAKPKVAVSKLLYRTASLNLACYLVASNRLALDHIEPRAKHSEFYFVDAAGAGPAIATEFITQDLKCSAKLLLETRSDLLNVIRRNREVGGGDGDC